MENHDGQHEGTASVNKIPDYCRAIQITDSNGKVREFLFPRGLDLERPKRVRTTFSPIQLQKLEAAFLNKQYLVGRERRKLAGQLGITETQVKVWFQNRRTKYKRERNRKEEACKSNAESIAAGNILRLLEEVLHQNMSTGPPCFHSEDHTAYIQIPPPSLNLVHCNVNHQYFI